MNSLLASFSDDEKTFPACHPDHEQPSRTFQPVKAGQATTPNLDLSSHGTLSLENGCGPIPYLVPDPPPLVRERSSSNFRGVRNLDLALALLCHR